MLIFYHFSSMLSFCADFCNIYNIFTFFIGLYRNQCGCFSLLHFYMFLKLFTKSPAFLLIRLCDPQGSTASLASFLILFHSNFLQLFVLFLKLGTKPPSELHHSDFLSFLQHASNPLSLAALSNARAFLKSVGCARVKVDICKNFIHFNYY